MSTLRTVAVIGAGPAGLFAARELANAGVQVALINRDIKAGGLAEYGIYPNKYKMKSALRKQFAQVLELPNVAYFGNVQILQDGPLSLANVQSMGFDAVLVCVGAQGTKWLGLEGEDLQGVYHAKDLVYHYNRLPPYSQQSFAIGQRVVCIGAGNVMLDIARWAIQELKVQELTAVVRRGPGDVKFTRKEMESVAANLDLAALEAEIARCAPNLTAVGQDPQEGHKFILSALLHAEPKVSDAQMRFDFLASPHRILGDEHGRVRALEVEDTLLVAREDGSTSAKGQGIYREIAADTVVFCIGDKVDANFGLPLDKWGDFAKHPEPRFPGEGNSYEAYDPETQQAVEGVFLAGWSREASTGVVGAARKDGTLAARAVLSYLDSRSESSNGAMQALESRLDALSTPVVRKPDLLKLEDIEAAQAEEHGLPEFKFSSNQDMLNAMGLGQLEQTS
ncbi:MAG: FAD-dependent oxidoreductase [Anaerolineales bacterium]|nr:FAD-dependent oxidoreductase [Anaerolineales bacterium]